MSAAENLVQLVRVLGLGLLLGSMAMQPSSAQDKKPAPAEPAPAESTAKPSNAPYMKPLGRLATVLGSLHFLRGICGDANADVWREKMDAILKAQSPSEADRRVLVAHFNQGYRAFESTYRKCTPAATVAVERYAKEGADLSREIGARYGN
ncbi:TIGR02301 family protein [Aureimonas sp. ME7]|uniref:TIGR02301 family protein n=1 Tax=Aureimonas sp. ME7 TaxID=2744252 RepID=UPI001FCF24DE|nr:TIGR02301 family protein [Aureimonas sp. ME7]